MCIRDSPKLAEVLAKRHIEYNKELEFCNELENKGNAIVLRPTIPMDVGRFERDKVKLRNIYNNGYDLVIENKEKILEFL